MAGDTVTFGRWRKREITGGVQQAATGALREAGKAGRRAMRFELGGVSPSAEGQAPGRDTGRLQRAVSYRTKSRRGKYSLVDIGILRRSPQDRKFPGEMHAVAVRLQRGFVGRDRTGRTYYQRGRPFVAQTLLRERPHLARIIETEMARRMPREF